MKLKALQDFTCYPGNIDANRMNIVEGQEFEIDDSGYAKMLVEKGHAEEVSAPAPKKPADRE